MPQKAESDEIETCYETADPRSLKLLDLNARFMNEREFRQLCDNIKRDGCLTSAPLVAEVNGGLVVLSGNHRVKASLAVGLSEIPIIRIKGEISSERMVAIQLSHNAISGEDDPNILRELYDTLPLLEQMYSGLTDSDLGVLEDPELAALAVELPKHQEMTIAFLPDDLSELDDNLKKIVRISEKHPVYFAKLQEYEAFFQRLVEFKVANKIGNEGVALCLMAEIMAAQLEAEDVEREGEK